MAEYVNGFSIPKNTFIYKYDTYIYGVAHPSYLSESNRNPITDIIYMPSVGDILPLTEEPSFSYDVYETDTNYTGEIIEVVDINTIVVVPSFNKTITFTFVRAEEVKNKYISNIEIDGENYLIKDSSIEEQLNTKLNVDADNLSEQGKKVLDGQFIPKWYNIYQNASAPTLNNLEVDLSSYLPNDNYNYDVKIFVYCRTAGNCEVRTASDFIEDLWWGGTMNTSSLICNTSDFPIGKSRKIVIRTNASSNLLLFAYGYRRIGTNE